MHQILMVDDNPGDIDLMRRAFAEARAPLTFFAAENAAQAFSFLRHKSQESFPNLILLDHHMPVFNGLQVLTIMHESEQLRRIPVIVFTSSTRDVDLQAALRAGAACVMNKPQTWDGYLDLVYKLVELIASPQSLRKSHHYSNRGT
jgi:two-component system, chemotaxis family, response regulator Rcp1